MFVSTLYGAAAFSGYLIAAIAGRIGWLMAGEIQMTLLCVIGAVLSLALRPSEMST
jgi:MFS transporter, DHA1 family, inner membrane transport protein